MSTGTEEYYAQRAGEYDRVYEKPERQVDIVRLGALLEKVFVGRDVLDVAAGTGFWTERFAEVARSVTSCDVNEEPLEIARARRSWRDSVTFTACDAFALDQLPGRFDAAFVGFFWSHLRLDQLDSFLAGLTRRLEPGATVVLVDNRYVEGSNHPITRTDERATATSSVAWPMAASGRSSRTSHHPKTSTLLWLGTRRRPRSVR